MYVIFLHGPAASGKHTIGSILSERTGLPLFHNHLTVDLVKTLFDFGTEPFRDLRANVWLESFRQAARADRSFIFTFHPEASVNPQTITDLEETVRAEGGEVYFVELRCPEDTVLERLGNESRTRFGKLVDGDLYQQISSSGGFDFPPMPEPVLSVDTDRLSPSESAKAIDEAIRSALSRS